MRIVSAVFRVLIGIVFGVLCFLALSPALAALLAGAAATLPLIALVLVGALAGFFSRSVRRAFGWAFLSLGLSVLALPLSTMLLAGRVAVEQTNAAAETSKGAAILGSGIAAGLLTGGAAIVGLFLGAILLIVALVLLLGGRQQVILVDRATGRSVTADSYDDDPRLPRGRRSPRIEPPPLE